MAKDQATIPITNINNGIVVYLAKTAHTISSTIWAADSVANSVKKLLLNTLIKESILPDYYFYILILFAFIWGFSKKESKT